MTKRGRKIEVPDVVVALIYQKEQRKKQEKSKVWYAAKGEQKRLISKTEWDMIAYEERQRSNDQIRGENE